ncbi:TetR/AcrR family transcriptional regulator [Roseixanthobacter glucoisosaccharinicivorans]|uniref:TetR/AcrR family transcriptional regulator n=1 Tax=Roseixanthobacter glucoisosaccharinicivorans TaxID=3119923 RepID=UPI00372AE866
MPRTIYQKSDVIPLIAEIFRELGYEGTSFGTITERTGISKGSLYHFFPGGKEEMAAEVLAEIEHWFIDKVYEPLERDDPVDAIERMWKSVDGYFRSGRRVCLVGAFALDATRDRFAATIGEYFERWLCALANCLRRAGFSRLEAKSLAEEIVLGIQGALVLARALDDHVVFSRTLKRLSGSITAVMRQQQRAGIVPGA